MSEFVGFIFTLLAIAYIFCLVVIILVVATAILWAIYLLLLVRPRRRKKDVEEYLVDYAHRGLHGKGVPENSLLAFRRAVESGVGIELDVQLSKDGEVMVFHDYTLTRMTGVDKKLSELEYSELSKLSLLNTDEKIPTLKEVLSLVDGKVPLLVELKGEDLDSSLCGKVFELLKEYKGSYCIESFNPLLLKKMRSFLPDVFYGQLYTNVCKDKKKYSPLNILLSLMAFNFLSKPDFIAYNKEYRDSLPVKITTRLYKGYKFVWTTRTKKEYDLAKSLGEHPIFEKE